MYDCSDTPGKVLHLPFTQGWDLSLIKAGSIDFTKYENWLRCMTVSRAAHLMKLLGQEWTTVYVHWDNNDTQLLFQTTVSSMSFKPSFIQTRPRRIWCAFLGGPPGKPKREIKSSLLNFLVEQVYHHIVKHGEELTDAYIIESLNFKETLYLADNS